MQPSDMTNLTLPPIVMLIYDTLLTFDREVRYIWRLPVTLSAVLFFLMRYIALSAACVLVLLEITPLVTGSIVVSLLFDLSIGVEAYSRRGEHTSRYFLA